MAALKVYLMFILALVAGILHGQDVINGENFISRSISIPTDELNMSAPKVNFPWIEEIDIRTQSDRFDLNRQNYTTRFSFSTPKIRKAQRNLYDHIASSRDYAAQEYFCQSYEVLHRDWMDMHCAKEQTYILGKIQEIRDEEEILLSRLAAAEGFDFKELTKLEMDRSDLRVATKELEIKISTLEKHYHLQGSAFNFDNFISVNEIRELVVTKAIEQVDLDLERNQHRFELLERELALEKAERKKIVDFTQFRLEGKNEDPFQDRFSIGIGLSIPNSGKSKIDILDIEQKQRKLQLDAKYKMLELEQDLVILKNQISEKIEEYDFFENISKQEEIQLREISDRVTKKEGFDPKILLDIQKRVWSNRYKSSELREDIYSIYLELLSASGMLCSGSIKNWFEATDEVLTPVSFPNQQK